MNQSAHTANMAPPASQKPTVWDKAFFEKNLGLFAKEFAKANVNSDAPLVEPKRKPGALASVSAQAGYRKQGLVNWASEAT